MNRILGLTVALVVPLSLATTGNAQTMYYNGGAPGPGYGGPVMAGQLYGGFGTQYTPTVGSDGYVVDQWGGVHPVAYTPAPPVVVVQPTTRVIGSRLRGRRAVAQPLYQLPTGSLGSSGGNGVMLYSPDARYAGYGSGYGAGPYGMADHRVMWKW